MKSWLGSVTNVTHRQRHYDYPRQLHREILMTVFEFSVDVLLPCAWKIIGGLSDLSALSDLPDLADLTDLHDEMGKKTDPYGARGPI